jgi:ABC-type cobalamin/Fe3+-siderophores transport system ATPase subunit
MKIKRIRLQRFRQFSDTSIDVGDFNVLVGPNNSGKTTILHAVRAFFLLMHGHVRFEGDPPVANYHRRFLSSAEEIAPTPDIKELWYQQSAGKPLTISVTFEDDVTFSVSLRQQFGQIHVSAEDLPAGLTAEKAAEYLGTEVAFIPGLVGVLVTEPFATRARRNALATQGRYSEIFRSSLQQLKSKNPELVEQINSWLSDLFGVTVSAVDFDSDSDEYVTVKYSEKDTHFDVASSGAGLQQVIQMLTYLYLTEPRVLLIDEPDAHLHSKLQARLGQLFRRVAADLGAQVFLSTHSLDLIDTFSTTEVTVVDSSKKQLKPIGSDVDLVSVLVNANIVDVSALSRILVSKRLVVVEDDDQVILKTIDKGLGSLLFSSKSNSYVLPAKGVGNFRAIAQLGEVLRQLTGSSFDITFLQDRDGLPDFLVDAFRKSQAQDGVHPYLLERHEIESYIIEPSLFVAGAARVGKTISEEDARAAIMAAATELKAEARRMSRESAKGVNRHLGDADRKKEADLEIEVDKWFDDLDLTSLDVIQRVFPGKELLKRTLANLKAEGADVTRGHVIASIIPDLVGRDLRDFITSEAAKADGNQKS